jgi:hypothetical protein
MATVEQCRAAIDELGERLSRVDAAARAEHVPDRTLACTLLDLDVTFSGRLHRGDLVDVTTEPAPPAQIRLVLTSDDLIDLVEGRSSFAHAWSTGRVHLDASLRDLLRLRALR